MTAATVAHETSAERDVRLVHRILTLRSELARAVDKAGRADDLAAAAFAFHADLHGIDCHGQYAEDALEHEVCQAAHRYGINTGVIRQDPRDHLQEVGR